MTDTSLIIWLESLRGNVIKSHAIIPLSIINRLIYRLKQENEVRKN